jgi:hypothetical protein
MQRLARYLLPMLSAPLLASCVFLLDYNDLKKGKPAVAATGGQGGMSATPSGMSAGGAASCGDCDDKDPCTIDTCDETGDTPTCMHEATEGLKLDGLDTTLTALRHVRVSLVGSGKLFYLASTFIDKNAPAAPKVSLYRLGADATELEPIGADLKLDGNPVSGVGLAVEELPLGDVALHGFIAAKLKRADAAKVFHLVNHNDQTLSNVVGLSYNDSNDTVFPQALVIGSAVVGSWIQADGTIAVHDVGSVKTDTFGASTLPATTLSLLSTADEKPAVMFTAESGPLQALGTYIETSGMNRSKLAECDTRPGDYLSSSVVGTQIPGLWLANITRAGADYLTNAGGTLICGANQCTAAGDDCTKATPGNGIRDVAGATVRFDTDPPGIVYSVIAVPQIAAKADDATAIEGKLSLALGQTDFSAPGKAKSKNIGGDPSTGLMQIAQNDTSEALGFLGPDWPAVSILPTEQVAVAWIQPNAAADGTELHVQRYKMCLPPP